LLAATAERLIPSSTKAKLLLDSWSQVLLDTSCDLTDTKTFPDFSELSVNSKPKYHPAVKFQILDEILLCVSYARQGEVAMTQPHCALPNVNEVLDSDKEVAGDGDKDIGTDDDQPALPCALTFEIDLNRHLRLPYFPYS
jgi:hypothetical protein